MYKEKINLDGMTTLEDVVDSINNGGTAYEAEEIAGQWAYESAKESEGACMPVSRQDMSVTMDYLVDAGAVFDYKKALSIAMQLQEPSSATVE